MARISMAWFPRQHGAWAMLLTPLIIGAGLRARTPDGLPLWFWFMALAWLMGYLTFFAAGRWLKAPAARRAGLQGPLIGFGAATAVTGVAMALTGGLPVAWWAPVFALPLAITGWQTAIGRERSVLSGVASVLAAALMIPVAVYTTPQAAWAAAKVDPSILWITILTATYFAGTVPHVKALIRERGQAAARKRTIIVHLVFLIASIVVSVLGLASMGWPGIFAIALARTMNMTRPGAHYKPLQIGLVEIGLTVAIIALALLTA